MPKVHSRRATHAGSWYTDDCARLDTQLDAWLQEALTKKLPSPTEVAVANVQVEEASTHELPISSAKAIIGPHAGYAYSGPAAAYAYATVPASSPHIKRIFVLGPSHHCYIDGCALSRYSTYDTPLGPLTVDRDMTEHLHATGSFELMSQSTDEAEHSIELHMPYIRKVFIKRPDITIVPILVGAISTAKEIQYGKILAPYLASEENFFVISSDFCHWGSRFSYTFYRPSPSSQPLHLSARVPPLADTPIHQSIRELDDEGIHSITFASSSTSASSSNKTAQQSQADFAAYLRRTKNTVCGRHPIGILLGALSYLETSGAIRDVECRFTRYEVSMCDGGTM